MTPKEKAEQLFHTFQSNVFNPEDDDADFCLKVKGCATDCVNEIINANPHGNPLNSPALSSIGYWVEVKKEIENL